MKISSLSVFLLLLPPQAAPASGPVFQEKGGVVAIEAESAGGSLGKWERKTDVKDYSGECHLEFTGNKAEGGPPGSALEYKFVIQKAGTYQLALRARKRLDSKRTDISNDCYVSLKGDFEAGDGAPLKVLKEDTKLFGGDDNGWAWAETLDFSGGKKPAIYQLKSGETYTLKISGRSKNFNLDRILLVRDSEKLREVQRDNPPESKTSEGAARTSGLVPRAMRTLKNRQGRRIEAELLLKSEGVVVVLVKGRRHEIQISDLAAEDQEFLADWEPGKPGE